MHVQRVIFRIWDRYGNNVISIFQFQDKLINLIICKIVELWVGVNVFSAMMCLISYRFFFFFFLGGGRGGGVGG